MALRSVTSATTNDSQLTAAYSSGLTTFGTHAQSYSAVHLNVNCILRQSCCVLFSPSWGAQRGSGAPQQS